MPTKFDLDRSLDNAAREINELQRASGLAFVVHLGEIITRHFFAGDTVLLHRQGPKKRSLSQLARRDDITLSTNQLSQAVAIYEIAQRHGDFSTSRNLGKSHLVEVLPLGPPDQDRLLELAEAEDWSVRRMRDEVAKLRPGKGPRPSAPPPQPHPVVALATRFDRALDALGSLGELPDWSGVDHATLVATEAQLAEAEERLGALRRSVRDALVVPTPPSPVTPTPVTPPPVTPPSPSKVDRPRGPRDPLGRLRRK